MVLVAIAMVAVFMGGVLPTPLYPLYHRTFHFGPVVLTWIYAVYVVGNLAALLVFGRLSDQIGRRRAALPALGVGLASTAVFILAKGVAALFVARVLSGFATGLGSGALTAWIAELQPRKDSHAGALAGAGFNFVGLAAAPLLSGVLAARAPSPLRLCYVIYLAVLVIGGAAVLGAKETVARPKTPLAEISWRPRVGVPRGIRAQFVTPAVTVFVTFALFGFYAALIPGLLAERLRQTSPLTAGLIASELFAVAALAVAAARRLSRRAAMLTGLALFPLACGALVWADVARSLPLLLIATVVGGAAGSLGYRGSLEVINAIAPADCRSQVVSSYLLASFGGNSLPVIGVGLLASATSAILAHLVFAVVIGVLAVAGGVVGLRAPAR
jgi:hypothetical protein